MRESIREVRSDGPVDARHARVGASVLLGTALAMVAVFIVVTLGIGAVSESYSVGATLGLFCAFWGGIGFGVMFSGAVAVLRDGSEQPRSIRAVSSAATGATTEARRLRTTDATSG